ncbi:MAG: ABC transporter ATP-binding protein [Flavobacteriales bacterium]
MLLKINNATYKYPESRPASGFFSINLNVDKGQTLSLFGNSGSGKSTLLKAIYGLINLDKGSLFINGKRAFGPSRNLVPGHSNVKLVSQHYELLPNHTAEENIFQHLHFMFKKDKRRIVDSLVELFELKECRKKKPNCLSAGQQQRTAIATALANVPDLLLLDEAFNNLDFALRQSANNYITHLQQEYGMAVVYVSHHTQEAFRVAHKAAVMQKGRIVQEGSPEELYFKPKTEGIASLFGASFPLNLDEISEARLKNQTVIRPENFIQSEDKSAKPVQVVRSVFNGGNYLNYAETSDSVFVAFYSDKPRSGKVKLICRPLL